MTLTGIQKKGLVFFVCTLVPAYWLANWRHEVNVTALTAQLQREEALHRSTEKLVTHCQLNAQKEDAQFDASHQICAQGIQSHAQTARQMDAVRLEIMASEPRRFQNFALYLTVVNVLGFIAFKFKRYFQD